jgi:hypothetical protein
MSITSSKRIPPDPHGAAGPDSLIAVVNAQIEGVRKDGTGIFGPDSLDKMLGASRSFPSRPFDPKIVYDVHRKRFVLVALDRFRTQADVVTESWIYVAVSKTHDPQSATAEDWHIHEINSRFNNTWADFPGLAVDEEAIYITTNQLYSPPPYMLVNPQLWIIAKEPFYSGDDASFSLHDFTGTSYLDYGTYSPAMVRKDSGIAPSVGTYLVMYNGLSSSPKGNEFVQIVQVNSPLNNPNFTKVGRVNIGNIERNPLPVLNDGPQKDEQSRGRLVDTGKRRALQAVWVNDQLWMTMTVSDGTQTSAYWVKFSANGIDFPPTFVDKGKINGEDIAATTFTAFPALDVNAKGVAAFGFSAFSLSFYPSAFATIRDDNVDQRGTVRPANLVRAGEGPYFLYSLDANADAIDEEKKINRWGDYSSISWDPDDQDCFWAFNEYAGNESWSPTGEQFGEQFGSWKTAWARLCYTPPPCKGVRQGCVRTAQCCAPGNKVCEGPSRGPTTCKICRGENRRCARHSQCCGRLSCKNNRCRP